MDPAGMKRLLHTNESTALAMSGRLCQTHAYKREQCSRIGITGHLVASGPENMKEQEMSEHVIVGAGAVGSAAALLLAERGEHVRIVSRRGGGPEHPAIELVAADATDAERLTALCQGAAALYNCASPQYHQWLTDWPPLAAALLAAAERSGAVLASMSNLYSYGQVHGP